MFKRRFTAIALFSSILWLSSAHKVLAQSIFSKSLFYDTSQSQAIFGFPDDQQYNSVRISQDYAGQYLTPSYGNRQYAYYNNGSQWINLLPENTQYDTGIHPTNPRTLQFGDGKVLLNSENIGAYQFQNLYVSDGSFASSISRNADLGDLNPRFIDSFDVQLTHKGVYVTIDPFYDVLSTRLYLKEGNSPLTRISSEPFVDPRNGMPLRSVRIMMATEQGVTLGAYTQDDFSVFAYQNNSLERLFGESDNLFGEGRPYYGGNGISMRESQGRYLISYHSSTTGRHNIALYDRGSYTRVLQEGQDLPNGLGIVSGIYDAAFEGDTVIMVVSLGTPSNPYAESALLHWKDGQYQLIDRFSIRPDLSVIQPLSE